MRLFKIQNLVPKPNFFRMTKKKDRYPESWIPRIPAYSMSEITPPPSQLWPNLNQLWRVWSSPTWLHISSWSCHVHKSGMPNFAHCRHAVTISSSPSQTHPLTGDLHLGTLICWRERGTICWRGSDENCWRGKDENCWREMKVGPEGGRVWF